MPVILIYYLVGLTLALVVGAVCYYAVGFAANPFWQRLFGDRAGPLGGRLFRISIMAVALVGALSTKFYGCSGPTDYAEVARDHREMLVRTTSQVSGSMNDTATFLILTAAAGAIGYSIFEVSRRPRRDSSK